MKTVYIIGGTMGIGKTTVCQQMKNQLNNSVFWDGDWCWDAHPFQVTDETKNGYAQYLLFAQSIRTLFSLRKYNFLLGNA